MTRKRPIFAIKNEGVIVGLVRASSGAQALRHHVAGQYSASVATQDDLVAALPGIEVADAGRSAEPEPDDDPPIPTLTDPVDDGHDGSEI